MFAQNVRMFVSSYAVQLAICHLLFLIFIFILTCAAAGTPAMTSRGLTEEDFEQVAGFLHEVLQVRTATIVTVILCVIDCPVEIRDRGIDEQVAGFLHEVLQVRTATSGIGIVCFVRLKTSRDQRSGNR
jgi:hypothetical protein